MRLAQLVMREHEEFGTSGFHIRGLDWQEPTTGMGLAHDLLEHFPGDTGTMEEEMTAFGASLYVRGEDYFYQKENHHSAAKNLAADFPNFCGYMEQAGRYGRLRYAGLTKKLEPDVEDKIDELKAELFRLLPGEGITIPPWIKHFEDIRGWMRVGYRKAWHRYRGMRLRGGVPFMFFMQVEEMIDRVLKHASDGEEFTVRLDLTRYHSSIDYKGYSGDY